MTSIVKESRDAINIFIWGDDLRTLPALRRLPIRVLRFVYVLVRDLLSGQLNLRAMSLVYTTLLSLVPLLAVSFSVLKGFGVHNQIEPLLFNFLEPLGPEGHDVATQIVSFVENVRVGVLGSVGLALLIYTVISLMQKIEGAFNYVWRIESSRSLSQRFSNYLSVILIGPVMIFTALGITASVSNYSLVQYLLSIEPFGSMILSLSRLLPYFLVCLTFTFIYVFIPNTRVRLGAALAGGLVAGILWQTTGWAFAAFIAGSAKYAAIYSGFAILIMLLIWLYISWLVLLVGAQLSFYVQNPQYLTMTPVRLVLSNRLKERLALIVMYMIGEGHYYNRAPWSLESLSEHLDLPSESVQNLLSILVDAGYITPTASEPNGYLPARDIETIQISDLLLDVRREGESRFLSKARVLPVVPVDEIINAVEDSVCEAIKGKSLRDLVVSESGESQERSGPKVVGK